MIQLPDDRRPPLSPQLALRIAILGGIALVLFAVVFFRLWYLQVLSGTQYVSQAQDNQVRSIRVPAPRGEIVDRNGATVVTNRNATVVQIQPAHLPAPGAKRRAVYRRLANVIQMSPTRIQTEVIRQRRALPYANVTVKTDVPPAVLAYLKERQGQFPGVIATTVFLRRYPYGTLAAQLLGYIGQITPTQLKQDRFRGVRQGAVVGQAGLEWEYDRYLRGRDGADLLSINSLGQFQRQLRRRQPIPGRNLKLSLDLGLQKAGQQAVARAGGGNPGGFVAMDPRNGDVLALGSTPSFNPSVFAKPLSQSTYRALTSQTTGAPLFNRAIAGSYPTGSTFKIITALAGLNSGVITPDTVVDDQGCIKIGLQQFCGAGHVANGAVNLQRAIQVSSDVYFYTVGRDLDPLKGEPLQKWARKMGLGRKTGIDLPEEAQGNVPDRKWRAQLARVETQCEHKKHVSSCGISDKRPWSTGDNVNLSIGQGDLLASPLQMAVAYSTLVNGGKVPRPHLGLEVDDSQGRVIQQIEPPAARHVTIPPNNRAVIMQGLHAAASAAGGTSADVWSGWPQSRLPVFGKTGTAQRPGQADQSWYLCYIQDQARPIVIAVTIEKAGFGAQAAAPAARLIASRWFGIKAKFVVGKSHTR